MNLVNPASLLDPKLARRDVRRNDVAHFAARLAWHGLFDMIPGIERGFGSDSTSVLHRFRENAVRERLALDWRCHVRLLDWLSRTGLSKGEATIEECLAATAGMWASNHFIDPFDRRCVIVLPLSRFAFGGERPRRISEFSRVVKLARTGVSACKEHALIGVGEEWNSVKFRGLYD